MAGVDDGPGIGVSVAVGVAVGLGVDAVAAQYLPPVFKTTGESRSPPHTIISLPVQMAVTSVRPAGTLTLLVAVQLLLLGLYLAPVLVS